MVTVASLNPSQIVGIDWASENHAVCVIDDQGRKRSSFSVEHSRDGFDTLAGKLARYGQAGEIPVGIERPDGRLVDRLLEAGHPVVPVFPNTIKEWRKAEVISGAKTDAGDARLIAEYVRLCAHKLDILVPFTEHTRALRALTRSRDDMVTHRVAAANQLEACLDAFWPGAKNLFSDVTTNIGLAFLERYPTPTTAARLGEKRMAAFLQRNGYSGNQTAGELIERLRAAPPGIPDGAESQARQVAVGSYVATLRTVKEVIASLDRSIITALGEHPDSEIFTSLPRSGRINAAQMLAEWGDSRQAYDSPDAVAALAGIVPVTKQSGKHQTVAFRWACNKRLRQAITTFADNSRHASPWAADIYQRARDRNCDHPHAVRILARAWVRVIYRCWIDGVAYDPQKHQGAQQHNQAAA